MLRGSQSCAPTGRDALRRIRVSATFSTLLTAAVRLLEDVIQARAFAAIVCVCVVNPALVILAKVVKSPATLFTEGAG
jgi:hypothetical protein